MFGSLVLTVETFLAGRSLSNASNTRTGSPSEKSILSRLRRENAMPGGNQPSCAPQLSMAVCKPHGAVPAGKGIATVANLQCEQCPDSGQ
jgi:hypothetical protein